MAFPRKKPRKKKLHIWLREACAGCGKKMSVHVDGIEREEIPAFLLSIRCLDCLVKEGLDATAERLREALTKKPE